MESALQSKKQRYYIAIDLKSFYASVECVERGLDPLTTNLVVADPDRTEKTICLAVSPSLKAYGIPGRARLFEVVAKTKGRNIEYIVAKPRMALYMEYSTRIYNIYLKYVAAEDMHVYSVDEVFLDVTGYLKAYGMTPLEMAKKLVKEVLETTGITATAGVGTNMYLCKVAMDVEAKHVEADADGVRIAYLDEQLYREKLWGHRPLTDFWRVGKGIAKKLEENGLFTMGDIARCSLGGTQDFYNEELLYHLFGINAELLIDHAWGYEPCTIKDIKGYKPMSSSLSTGQVLKHPYDYEKTRLIVQEMTDLLSLDLVDKHLVTDQLVLTIGYDIENLKSDSKHKYQGEITIDRYGRKVPKHAHGTINLKCKTASTHLMTEAVMELFDRIMDPALSSRRITVVANRTEDASKALNEPVYEQLSLFTTNEELKQKEAERERLSREKKMQEAILDIKKKYGKNAIVRGLNLKEGATTIERNGQIGGHKA